MTAHTAHKVGTAVGNAAKPLGQTDPLALDARDLEKVACPVCGTDAHQPRFDFRPFAIVECPRCRSAWLSPRLREEAIREVYENGYYTSTDGGASGYEDYRSLEPGLRRTARRRYGLVRRYVRGHTVVEIGCALGYSLDCLREDFTERIGIDVAPEAIDEVCRRGHRGHCGTFASAELAENSADLVLCMETIEHVYAPRELTGQISRILRPGGIVAMVTPDYHSLLRRLSGRRWVSFKIPEHVVYFSRQGMRMMLAEHDLQVVKFLGDRQYSPLGMVLDRAGKVWPLAARLAGTILWPLVGLHRFVPIYNGMFLVIARKGAR